MSCESNPIVLFENKEIDNFYSKIIAFPFSQSWSLQVFQDGADDIPKVSIEATNEDDYSQWANYSVQTTDIPVVQPIIFFDNMFAMKYFRIKIDKGLCTTGKISAKVFIKEMK